MANEQKEKQTVIPHSLSCPSRGFYCYDCTSKLNCSTCLANCQDCPNRNICNHSD